MASHQASLTLKFKCAKVSLLLDIIMPEAKFEKPKIKVSPSGVAFVSASDILMSRVGREEIENVTKFVVARISKRVPPEQSDSKPLPDAL